MLDPGAEHGKCPVLVGEYGVLTNIAGPIVRLDESRVEDPLRNAGCSTTNVQTGIFVDTPSMTYSRRARPMRAREVSRSGAHAISFAMRES